MQSLTTKPFVDGYVFLEGPRWHDNKLWVSDIWAHKVYGLRADGRAEVAAEVAGRPSGLGFLPDGTPLVVSMEERRVYKIVHGNLQLHADVGDVVKAEINDMVVDASGRAYVGGMGYDLFSGADPEPGEIICIEPDGNYRKVADGLDFPNGMVVTEDAQSLIVAESFGARVSIFDRASNGDLSNQRSFAELEGLVPDGICLDRAGNVWVAGAMAGEFVQVSPQGDVITRIDVKPHAAIACQLGGLTGNTLYCIVYQGGLEDISNGKPGARIDTVEVDIPGAGSP